MRKCAFVASILFFLIVISVIYTGSWKDVSIAKSNKDDMILAELQDEVEINETKEVIEEEGIDSKGNKENKDNKVNKNNKTKVDKSTKDKLNKDKSNKDKSNKESKSDKKIKVNKVEPTKKVSTRSLYIGDSRTVGIAEYAGIKNADFYANVGLSVYNVFKDKAQVKGVGKVSIKQILSSKEYGRVYLMIGINELGYNYDKTVKRYREFVAYIRKLQPDAKVILQANLHVTKKRASGDKIVNNKMINRYNKSIEALADYEDIFYIDANSLFDDKSGNLSASMTSDGVHILAKYYKKWGQWIVKETADI
jgi:hypothetical protein